MSVLNVVQAQIGNSATAAFNFFISALSADGQLKFRRGNVGTPISDVILVAADGKVTFPNTPALPLNKFKSTPQNITATTVHTVAHGLAVVPELYTVVLKCVTAEANYAVGEEVALYSLDDSPGVWGVTLAADVTNVYVVLNGLPRINNRVGTATAAITAANWKLIVRAWS